VEDGLVKKNLLFVLAMLLLVACGGSDSPTGPSTGTIVFVSGDTCGAGDWGAVTVDIDGLRAGTFEFAGNRELARITVSAGQQHRVFVEVAKPRFNSYGPYTAYSAWEKEAPSLKAGQTYTITLICS
jgi:hypothetical protein